MLSILPALRSFRVSLLTGTLLLISLYLLFADRFRGSVQISDAAKSLLGFSDWIPTAFGLLVATLIGSLYVTALEGLMDWTHRRLVNLSDKISEPSSYVYRLFAPLSDSASTRIRAEAHRFYEKDLSEQVKKRLPDENTFVSYVVREVLWLDGKLAGTALEDPHNKFRSEGELRLSVGLLIPLCAAAAVDSFGLSQPYATFWFVISLPIGFQTASYGLYYFRRAHSFLAHHVADGKLLTPSMESALRLEKRAQTEP